MKEAEEEEAEDAGKEASGGMLAILMLIHQRDENNAAGARESGQGGGQGAGPACREGPGAWPRLQGGASGGIREELETKGGACVKYQLVCLLVPAG